MSRNELEHVDCLIGGFPCQPVSVAGKRQAQNDDRWLWTEFIRVVREVQPRIVVVENVPGLLTANDGLAFGEVLGDLAASGFDAEWDCIPAAAVGADHLRYRVFIVAYAASERMEGRGAAGVVFPSAHAGQELLRSYRATAGAAQWAVEPGVGRLAHGVSSRVDRLKGLGNAVVPQVAEWIARRIVEHEEERML